MIDFRKDVSERFIRYTRFDTMSDPSLAGSRRPTTPGQVVMQKALVAELEELGLEVTYGEEHVVHAILRANAQGIAPVAFMAHVDTADDVMGNGVKARVHDYEGGDIVLDGTVIRACDNPDLARCAGGRVITSDGTTLLGGDDKAGVAEIMEAVSYLVGHPEVVHGDVEVFFTPDEETGAGMDMFPYHEMISKVCYTLDGGPEGEIETECFNAVDPPGLRPRTAGERAQGRQHDCRHASALREPGGHRRPLRLLPCGRHRGHERRGAHGDLHPRLRFRHLR